VARLADAADADTVAGLLPGTTHLLHSIPPVAGVDPVLAVFRDKLAALTSLRWVGYLSTVGVYGGSDGAWVDESMAPEPRNSRAKARVVAEEEWLEFGREAGCSVQIFRLAGIYGPGRSAFEKLRDGTARRIIKPGQVFNRIHVDDIAATLEASIARPRQGAIYNVADNQPAAPEDVIAYAAELAGLPLPPAIPFEEADLTPMARSFYEGNRRISNELIKSELGVTLRYPTYRDGLAAILADDGVGDLF
jgi:nucleoside-diphosphate-sugar epimerase